FRRREQLAAVPGAQGRASVLSSVSSKGHRPGASRVRAFFWPLQPGWEPAPQSSKQISGELAANGGRGFCFDLDGVAVVARFEDAGAVVQKADCRSFGYRDAKAGALDRVQFDGGV